MLVGNARQNRMFVEFLQGEMKLVAWFEKAGVLPRLLSEKSSGRYGRISRQPFDKAKLICWIFQAASPVDDVVVDYILARVRRGMLVAGVGHFSSGG